MRLLADKSPVTTNFPSEFTLEVRHPPPPEAARDHEGYRIHTAAIVAFEAGHFRTGQVVVFDEKLAEEPEPAVLFRMMGQTTDMIVHVERELPPSHPLSVIYGGITKPGFHLLTMQMVTEADKERRRVACQRVSFPGCEQRDPERDLAIPEGGLEGHRVNLEVYPPLAAYSLHGVALP